MALLKGILLDVNYKNINDNSVISLLFKDIKTNKKLVFFDKTFKPYFYVLPLNNANEALKEIKKSNLNDLINEITIVEKTDFNSQKKIKVLKILTSLASNVKHLREEVLKLDSVNGNILRAAWAGDTELKVFNERGILEANTAPHSGPTSNVITRALGHDRIFDGNNWHDFKPEFTPRGKLEQGRYVVIASDGLWDVVDDYVISQIIASGGSCEEITKKLKEAALQNGTKDNVTILVLKAK